MGLLPGKYELIFLATNWNKMNPRIPWVFILSQVKLTFRDEDKGMFYFLCCPLLKLPWNQISKITTLYCESLLLYSIDHKAVLLPDLFVISWVSPTRATECSLLRQRQDIPLWPEVNLSYRRRWREDADFFPIRDVFLSSIFLEIKTFNCVAAISFWLPFTSLRLSSLLVVLA